jgi:hypothetical protein
MYVIPLHPCPDITARLRFDAQAQVVWEELFPFADRKALRASRLMGLKEHPQV